MTKYLNYIYALVGGAVIIFLCQAFTSYQERKTNEAAYSNPRKSSYNKTTTEIVYVKSEDKNEKVDTRTTTTTPDGTTTTVETGIVSNTKSEVTTTTDNTTIGNSKSEPVFSNISQWMISGGYIHVNGYPDIVSIGAYKNIIGGLFLGVSYNTLLDPHIMRTSTPIFNAENFGLHLALLI